MNTRSLWSKILTVVGGIAMLVGAIDPMEGSLLILPGSGLVALGTFLGQSERRLIGYRLAALGVLTIGGCTSRLKKRAVGRKQEVTSPG